MQSLSKTVLAIPILVLAAAAFPAKAATILFDTPTGVLGTSQAYGSVTAYGFANDFFNPTVWDARNLDGKNAGAGEQGVGLFFTPDDEINAPRGSQAVIVDLTSLIGQDVKLDLNSVQAGEEGAFGFAASFNTASPNKNAFGSFVNILNDLPVDLGVITSSDKWLAIEATDGNVLLSSLTATAVPEPATLAVLGAALFGFGYIRRKRGD